MTFADLVIEIVRRRPGISDLQLSEVLGCSVQQVNGECRHLENGSRIERRKDAETIGNYIVHERPMLTVISGTAELESIEHR